MDSATWKKAEEIFLACTDLSEDERSRTLQQRCGDDGELKSLVLAMLSGDAHEDRLRESIGQAAQDLTESRSNRWIGTTIGAYTIENRIAEGGMGIVYLARRSDDQFTHKVAIKLLPTQLASDMLRLRFSSERQILANLKHINIAMLLDGGETEDGVPYLVMEYIEGVPIDQYCEEHSLSLEQRIVLFLDVCAALQYAHMNLIVHRDIKPSNILVTDDGVAKLLDFGIAKLIDPQAGDEHAALTMVGSRLFTPRHASPEQVLGQPISTASDVYSLGLLLYELLSGAFPYEITSTTSAGNIERIIATETAPLPSSLAAPGVAKRIRGDLDTITLKCVRKRPEDRYQSVAEVASDLERFLRNEPISARPPTRMYVLGRYWRRNRIAATGVLATLIAIVLGAAATSIGLLEARKAERLALLEAQNAEAISGFLVSLFEESNPNTSAGDERSVREILDIGRDRVDEELADSPLMQAHVLATLSGVYKGLADNDEAEALQQQALILAEQHAADDYALLARLRNDLGDLYRKRSKHADAVIMIESALTAYENAGVVASDELADAISNLGLTLNEMGEREKADVRLVQALAMRQQLFDAPHPKIALSLHNLAWHNSRGGDLELAEQYALDAVAMRERLYGEIHPRVAASVSLLSRIYQSRDKWDEAEREARRSVAIAEQIFDTGHPDLTFPMYELASVLREKGDLVAARDLFEQIVAWERVSLGENSHDFGMSLKAYANVLADLGEYAKAEQLLHQSKSIFEALPGSSRRGLLAAQIGIVNILVKTGRFDEARPMLANYFAQPDTPQNAIESGQPDLLSLQAEIDLAAGQAEPAGRSDQQEQ